MQRVTGIGGIFFKARDPKALQAWYRDHLGVPVQTWGGAKFEWKDEPDGADLDRERSLVAILSVRAHRCDARNTPRGSRNVHEPCPDSVSWRCDHRGVRELHSLDVNPAAWSVPSTR